MGRWVDELQVKRKKEKVKKEKKPFNYLTISPINKDSFKFWVEKKYFKSFKTHFLKYDKDLLF
jgi:hypothetical protein